MIFANFCGIYLKNTRTLGHPDKNVDDKGIAGKQQTLN